MKVYFIGAGPGDPELLTVKADRLIRECRCCIFAGSLMSEEIIGLIPDEAEKYDSAGMSLSEILHVIKAAREKERDVVRLHSGDPSIFGAINEQMNKLDRLGIPYEIIPGVSSFQAAAAALKTELTSPEVSQAVVLGRTSGRTPLPEGQELETLAATRATLCLFLSVHKVEEIAEILAGHYGRDCPAAVVYHASRRDGIVIRGRLSDIAEKTRTHAIKKTALIVVGFALERSEHVSRLYDSKFSHEYRKGHT